jgi:hypothetical protein
MTWLLAVAALSFAPQDPPPPGTAPARQDPDAAVIATPEEPVRATLQGCAMEEGRWVCRYQMPEIRIVEATPQNIVATPAGPAGLPDFPAADARPDVGALSERERALVTRCADAGMFSLCLPGDRRRARELRDASTAYEARRKDVTTLLAEGRCDAAVTAALEAGHLNLAREARAFCAR